MKIFVDADRLELIKEYKGTGVEIGVAEGYYSSKIMELGQVDKMYGVDPYTPHQGYRDYTHERTFNRLSVKAHERLDRYPNYEFIEDYSAEAARKFDDNSLDFVYIDGDHSYVGVTVDLHEWYPKVKPGGILAGDDYIRSDRDKRYYDVIHAVNDYVEAYNIPRLYLYTAGRNPTNWMFYK